MLFSDYKTAAVSNDSGASVSTTAVLDAALRSRLGFGIATGGGKGKAVLSMCEGERQESETVDIAALADDVLDYVIRSTRRRYRWGSDKMMSKDPDWAGRCEGEFLVFAPPAGSIEARSQK